MRPSIWDRFYTEVLTEPFSGNETRRTKARTTVGQAAAPIGRSEIRSESVRALGEWRIEPRQETSLVSSSESEAFEIRQEAVGKGESGSEKSHELVRQDCFR